MIDGLDALASGGAQLTEDQLEQRRVGRTAVDLATIIYTSGTTGRPKGCELTHGNLLAAVRNAVGALPEIFEIPGSATLLFLPLAHSFARIIQVACLESGAILGHWPDITTLAQGLPGFPRRSCSWCRGSSRRCTTAPSGTPPRGRPGPDLRRRHGHGDRLEQGGDVAAAGRGAGPLSGCGTPCSARSCVAGCGRRWVAGCSTLSGGAPLGERLAHFFRGAGITVLEGYGLTESSAAATVNRLGRNKVGTVGLPLPGVTIRIVGDGEILLKGPNVFPGYWRDDAGTREALDSGGWLRTGDLARWMTRASCG
jgi:long-chain acyl-CoA synthetase